MANLCNVFLCLICILVMGYFTQHYHMITMWHFLVFYAECSIRFVFSSSGELHNIVETLGPSLLVALK